MAKTLKKSSQYSILIMKTRTYIRRAVKTKARTVVTIKGTCKV